jgi:hypothetical protein
MGELSKEIRAKDIDVPGVVEIVDLVKGIVVVAGGQSWITSVSHVVIVVDAVHGVDEWYRLAEYLLREIDVLPRIIYPSTETEVRMIVSLLRYLRYFMEIESSFKIKRAMAPWCIVDIEIQRE